MSFAAFIGALVFLSLGLIELAVVRRAVYPAFRWRYEAAKLTQSQGFRPSRLLALVKIQSLVLMPLAGLFIGARMNSMFG